jgi:hypothetical protein
MRKDSKTDNPLMEYWTRRLQRLVLESVLFKSIRLGINIECQQQLIG